MGHQIGIHLRYLLGHEAELRDTRLIELRLVMEGDRTQGQERLAGSAHVRDIGLKPARREKHAQFAIVIHVTGSSTRANGLTCNAS